MPLTEDQRVLFYELAEIPFTTTVLYVDSEFGTGRKQIDYAITVAKTEIDARLDAMAAAPLARMQAILARWAEISTQSARVVPKEANEGVDSDFRRERSLLRTRALNLIGLVRDRDLSGADGIPLG